MIMSHDVDHLSWLEHWRDTYFYKFFLRSAGALAVGGITLKQFAQRFQGRQLNRVIELYRFNVDNDIPSTFFFGMRRGLGLSYSYKAAGEFISRLHDHGAAIGLHGMAYDSFEGLEDEKRRILEFLPADYPLGIRNHYLRQSTRTKGFMSDLGFLFDSTDYSLTHPYKVGEMWEIPISFMDAGIISQGRNDFESIRDKTVELFERAESLGLPFFVVNFHDVYFSEAFPTHLRWYRWLATFVKERGVQYTTFIDAVKWLSESSDLEGRK